MTTTDRAHLTVGARMPSAERTAGRPPPFDYTAHRNSTWGEVVIYACIDERGAVEEVFTAWVNQVALTASGLVDVALQALRRWRFRPYRWDGRPTPACVPVGFRFDYPVR